jgi:hypothetical protein
MNKLSEIVKKTTQKADNKKYALRSRQKSKKDISKRQRTVD